MTSLAEMKFDHLIGQEVGTATLIKELSRGSMALVFTAYQKTLKRQIAVKILPKSLLTSSMAELFQQEAESAAILSHPNIIQVYEVGDTDDFLFFTMPLIKGESLMDRIRMARKHVLPSRRFLPIETTFHVIREVLAALDYAHNQDIIHRDIKPANILIESHTNRSIITDFGIASLLRGPKVVGKWGTPEYVAPEQMTDDEIDERVDVYAAGTMLFEMLVSNLPFKKHGSLAELAKMKLALKDGPFERKPSEMNPHINKEMDEIVSKATAYEPADRFATCGQFLERLKAYESSHLVNEL
jgi:serine/threonine-protein kinase